MDRGDGEKLVMTDKLEFLLMLSKMCSKPLVIAIVCLNNDVGPLIEQLCCISSLCPPAAKHCSQNRQNLTTIFRAT